MPGPSPFDLTALTAEDPPPFEALNEAADPRFVLLCDHASHAVPQHMNGLGLSLHELKRHIGWDIGAAEVTRHLSRLLNAPAILSGYSRLVIDCNRPLDVASSILAKSDGTIIPNNVEVNPEETTARAEAFFWPYHNRVTQLLDIVLADGHVPVLVDVHSFTPEMNHFRRPWEAGLLWEHDDRLVQPLIEAFDELRPGSVVGNNEPYHIEGPSDYSIPVHGQGRGLPHIELEIRHDLIEAPEGALEWATLIAAALEQTYDQLQPLKIEIHGPTA